MKCPYCKKEIKIENNSKRTDFIGTQIINIFIPTIIVMGIGQFIDWIFKIDTFPIFGLLMAVVGIFYLIYGFLWEFGKVKGGLFITNLLK